MAEFELDRSGWKMWCWGGNGRDNELGKHPQEKLEEFHAKLPSDGKQLCPLISEGNWNWRIGFKVKSGVLGLASCFATSGCQSPDLCVLSFLGKGSGKSVLIYIVIWALETYVVSLEKS